MCLRCPKRWIAILEFLAYFVTFIIICIVVNRADKIMVDTRNETDRHSHEHDNNSKTKTVYRG